MKELFRIKRSLNDDEVLLQIKNKMYYLLSKYESKLLTIYLNDKRLIKYKKAFINSFINRLKSLDDKTKEKYLSKLKIICSIDKNDLPIQIGMIFDIDYHMPTNTTKLKDKPAGYSKDVYFNELIEKENYDELFNLYSIEQIERDSNLFDK